VNQGQSPRGNPSPGGNQQAAIVISAADNVATALEPIETGQTIQAGESTVIAAEPVPRGHKIALRAIHARDRVMKYGSPIGTASIDIAAGAHVHTHNVASARGRGDRVVPNAQPDRSVTASRAIGPEEFRTGILEREASAERTSIDAVRLAEPDEA